MSGRAWIAVASADHVRVGVAGGFMQVCHGKAVPLRRLSPGDRVAYYSPREEMRGGAPVQAFTALGTVREGAPYQVTMAPGFQPFRRDVHWTQAHPAPIRPLLEHLSFGGPNWGAPFRFGLFEVPQSDMDLIAGAMTGP
ncbi:MAG: EVE domain-containing protein [Rhodobacter sp.]|nr:EVE domain-containing protein [Paracoccaceae bacterium]MCC0077860.1 EVE domain-containing protein [Rhodobacter sp.]